MKISAILASTKDLIIEINRDVPWYLSNDLQYFKKVTLNHHIIMGRMCYECTGYALPNRTNIVLSRDPNYKAEGCIVANSIEEALQIAKQNGETEAFIVGGGELYAQTVDYWDKIYWTEVDMDVTLKNTDDVVYFPELDMSSWHLSSENMFFKDDKNTCDYSFKVFERVKIMC
jgi:dihydrofolate reductase